jgi:hypothetical protein
MEDLQELSALQKLFPDSDRIEIRAIRDIVLRFISLKNRAVLSTQSSAKILKVINDEWKEELEKSGREISRNIIEKLRSVYENEGWRGLQLRPMLVPVAIAAALVLISYLPHVLIPFDDIAGKTVSSFSALVTGNGWLIGGVVVVVGLALIVLLARNAKKNRS